MKITRRIGGSLSGVISTGSFENLRPGFTNELIVEWDTDATGYGMTDEDAVIRSEKLYRDCFSLMEKAESEAIVKRIQRERQDMRFVWCAELNSDVPSTTSVIGWDIDYFVPVIELSQYASQSNIVHAKVAHYIETREWVAAKELQDIWADIVIVSKGNLALPLEVGDFPGFLKKNPIIELKNAERTFNLELRTSGLADFIGLPAFDGALPVETVFDVKRTPDKVKDGMQLADYAKQHGLKQGCIIPLNDKTQQGHSKPIVYTEEMLEGFYKMFKRKREDFKKRYGI